MLFYLFYCFERRENVDLTAVYGYAVLKMGGRFAVPRHNSPFIREHGQFMITHSYHGLYGYAHAILQLLSFTALSIVGNLRIFVHITTDTMAYEFADNSVATAFCMLLHGKTDISQSMTGIGLCYSFIKTLLCSLEQDTDNF